ncbi:hypothetical protein [Stratiformator vulcanicus]|uniref:Uncharacterized protein n=1 Tax=Stratiformator vulcanicus TaxID=2527980 RepID=A0A517R354_9PLAN|nr:hypothetical protein [Stratiformator vulcanicus]QDT38293.1 hypothetical protein Pan189_26840 [Stratiformator vulcanicus]
MTTLGLIIMCTSVGTVLIVVSYCLFRVLTLPPAGAEDLQNQPAINTGDTGSSG